MRQPTLEDRIMKVWNVVDLLKDSLELDDEDEFRTTIAGLHNLAEQSMEKLFESFEASLQPTVANVSTLGFEHTPEAAAKAIAERVSSDQLNASFIVPSVFDPAVTPAVAQAVCATLGK